MSLLLGLSHATTEKSFQEQVIEFARLSGWIAYHTFDSRRSEPGFPDLVLARVGEFQPLFVELKSEKGRLSEAQVKWRETLMLGGGGYRLWRPSDWEEIEETLRRMQ